MSRSVVQSISISIRLVDRSSTYLHEVRKDSIPTPTWVAKVLPCIVVILTASIPAHGVQDTATTQYLSLRHWATRPIELHLWYCREIPVVDATNVSSDIYGILNDGLIVVTAVID